MLFYVIAPLISYPQKAIAVQGQPSTTTTVATYHIAATTRKRARTSSRVLRLTRPLTLTAADQREIVPVELNRPHQDQADT